MAGVLPDGHDLLALLGIAAVAAVLANIVNNLPAVLVLLPLVAAGRARRGAGGADRREHRAEPDLLGSLANLLWRRRRSPRTDIAPDSPSSAWWVCCTVPVALVVAVLGLWAVRYSG